MKIITLGVLLVLAAGGVFAETPQRVATDAEILLGIQQDFSAENRLFLESSILLNHENRIKLNEYRSRFNAIQGRIHILKHQITTALSARDPRIEVISSLRQQLTNLVDEHERIVNEFREWVSTLR